MNVQGENVVKLQVHLTAISTDGNIKDALLLATVSHLQSLIVVVNIQIDELIPCFFVFS